jgi:hypothetical protein
MSSTPVPRRSERRRARLHPEAQLTTGEHARYPFLVPRAWYPLQNTQGPDRAFVWLETPNGPLRVRRTDVHLRGRAW